MSLCRTRFFRLVVPCAILAVLSAAPIQADQAQIDPARTDHLTWRMAQNRVDAQIESWDLPKLLEQIAGATGWQIYFEPGTTLKRPVSARFKNIPTGDALSRLMGNLSYALIPGENGPSRLLVFQTSLENATKRVLAAAKKPAKAIPNELVISPKPGAKSSIDELAAKYGAKIIGRSEGLNAYRLQFSDEGSAQSARDSLLSNADVALVDYNFPVDRVPQPQAVTPSSATPDLNLKAGPLPSGGATVIGLIDTALQPTGGAYDQFLLPSISVAGTADPGNTSPSHGTSMLETMLNGVSKVQGAAGDVSVRILPVDVYGNSETTTTYDVALGIKAAIDQGAGIINLSLGSSGDSQILHNIITQGYALGRLFVAAAGNEPTTAFTFPGAYPEVVSVGALGNGGKVASYSNYGSWVDLYAPGTALVAYSSQYYLVSGTSASTATVSGLAAGIAATTGQSPLKSMQALESALRGNAPTK